MYILDRETETELTQLGNNKEGILRVQHMKPECNATYDCKCQVCNASGRDADLYVINVEVPKLNGVFGGMLCKECARTIFNRSID